MLSLLQLKAFLENETGSYRAWRDKIRFRVL
jgi:hypothetical protein